MIAWHMRQSKNKSKNSQQQLIKLVQDSTPAFLYQNYASQQGEKVELQCSLSMLAQGMNILAKKIVESVESYERNLQHLQQTLRKHIKNQIQLKLYYEHLEEVIANLKKQKQKDHQCIEGLKTELKEKEKYLMTITNQNTKSGDQIMGGLQSKLDTITKIKNRLSLNDTGDFYGRNFAKRNERQYETKDLHHKRQNLETALEKLCEKPSEKSTSKKKIKQKSKSKIKKQLQSSKSGRSLHTNSQVAQSPAQKNSKMKGKSKQKEKPTRIQNNYIKSGLSSRRNSKC